MSTVTEPGTAPAPQTTTPAPVADAPDPSTLVDLDPATLVRDEQNARTTDTEPDDKLIASVKALGVEEPVSVRPLNNGAFGVFKGWRRAQAAQIANATAIEEGREPIAVQAFVRADLVGQDGWTRFLSLTENHNRASMSERDTVEAVELSLIGMDELQQQRASRAMGLSRNAKGAARRAAKLSDTDLRRASADGLDLFQQAELAEVKDITGAFNDLTEAKRKDDEEGLGKRGHWDHAMARLRQQMTDSATRETALKELAEAGIPLLRDHFGWGQKDTSRPLSDLTTNLFNPVTAEMHASCPGHSARLDEDNKPVWHCSDPETYQHRIKDEAKKPTESPDPAKLAERRNTIARNKAWRAAREPRKDFITGICQGKTLPEEARKLALTIVMNMPSFYRQFVTKEGTDDVARFLGAKKAGQDDHMEFRAVEKLVERISKAKESHALFAHVAAAFEHSMRDNKAWARLFPEHVTWLETLVRLGYTLSEVEADALTPHRASKDATDKAA